MCKGMWKLSISNVKARDTAIPDLAKMFWSMGNVMGIDPYHRYGSLNPNPNPNPVHIGARQGLGGCAAGDGPFRCLASCACRLQVDAHAYPGGKTHSSRFYNSTLLRFYASPPLRFYNDHHCRSTLLHASTLLRFYKPVWCPQP